MIGINEYYKYLLIREVEKKIIEIFPSDKIQSPVHLSFGGELPSILISSHTTELDKIFPSYRGHAAYFSHGGNLKRFFAELYGKATGASSGYGGSMHMIDLQKGIQGTSAVVASHIPIACGTAYTMKETNNIVVVYFGEGATESGSFFESINLADLYNLPVLFVCENNSLADSSPMKNRRKKNRIYDYVKSFFHYRINYIEDDIPMKYKRIRIEHAISKIRTDRKPCFFEFQTLREIDHVGIDNFVDNELHPIYFEISDNDAYGIKEEILKRIDEAIKFAEKSPIPENLIGWK